MSRKFEESTQTIEYIKSTHSPFTVSGLGIYSARQKSKLLCFSTDLLVGKFFALQAVLGTYSDVGE